MNLDFDIFGYNKLDGYGMRITDIQLVEEIFKEFTSNHNEELRLF